MPPTRRTRAMGYSPGGPKALDINAPTRQPRKAKTPAASKDASALATRTTRARPGPKRKNQDDIAEAPPTKKSRRTKPAEGPELLTSGSKASINLLKPKNEHPESTSSSQEGEPTLGSEKIIEPRVNAQQPTPPLDTPVEASTIRLGTKTPRANMRDDSSFKSAQHHLDRKKQNGKRISDMIRQYHTIRHEEEEDEKALSECDDDEWEQRYSTVMEQAKNPTPFISNSKSEWEKWTPGSAAMFVVREPKGKDTAARNKSGPCMQPLSFSPGFSTTASHLAALGKRSLTNIGTIVAVSASLDWYEKNPTISAPSAAEMNAMLDNFARGKQAQQTEATNLATRQGLQNPTSDTPQTPKAQVTSEDLAQDPRPSESNDDHSNIDHQQEQEMEQNGDNSANIEQNRVEALEPQTPRQQDGSQVPRTWASALSASAIGNIILTPLNNWFSRRDRDRRNAAATEPRPARPEPEVTRPAKSHQKSRSQETPTQSSKILPAKNSSLHNARSILALDSPTPTASRPRQGRPDSHLPVHLRGVLFEDLPTEWQAVSEHLKKPQHVQVQEEEDESVDMEYLLATARRVRKERDRKELQEQAELIARKQRDLESDDEIVGDRVDRTEKKRVTFSPRKTYYAKLGHSTFGMPTNIDDSSSEEEAEDLGPRTHFGRSSRPMKSCLKRSYQHPKSEDYSEKGDGEEGQEPHPAKRARLDDFESSQSSAILEATNDIPWRGEGSESFLYDDDPRRARPFSHFISKPPSELRKAEAAQLEYERLNPRSRSRDLTSELNRSSYGQRNEIDRPNTYTNDGGNPNQAWLNLFKEATKNQSPIKQQSSTRPRHQSTLVFGPNLLNKRRTLPPSQRDENGRLIRTTAPLRNVSEARLNKQREDAMKHRPKTSSGLQVAHTLSPVQEKPLSKNMIVDDEEVLKLVALLEDEIVAESFGKYPEHIEATVSREASKAIEQSTGFDTATAAGENRRVEDTAKTAEVAEGEAAL